MFSVRKHLESYGSIWINRAGMEVSSPVRMTERQALYWAGFWGGYVVSLESF